MLASGFVAKIRKVGRDFFKFSYSKVSSWSDNCSWETVFPSLAKMIFSMKFSMEYYALIFSSFVVLLCDTLWLQNINYLTEDLNVTLVFWSTVDSKPDKSWYSSVILRRRYTQGVCRRLSSLYTSSIVTLTESWSIARIEKVAKSSSKVIG